MPDMEEELRELLQERAGTAGAPPDVPPTLLRRARRRRLLATGTTLCVVAASVVGGVAGLRSLALSGTPQPGNTTSPTANPTASPFSFTEGPGQLPAIWPETNLVDIQAAQQNVGSPRRSWGADPLATAMTFAQAVLRLPEHSATLLQGVASDGHVVVGFGEGQPPIRVHLAQLASQGQDGIWSVTDVETDGLTFQAGPVRDGQPCPEGVSEVLRNQPAQLCAILKDGPPGYTMRYALFQGESVDLANFNSAPIRGDLQSNGQFFTGGMTENVPQNASILLVEALDKDGNVIAVGSDRLANQAATVSNPATAIPAIWPETTLQALQGEQARVNNGDDAWRKDPEELARRFAVQVMGWDPAKISDRILAGGPAEITFVDLWNLQVNKEAGMALNDPSLATTVAIQLAVPPHQGVDIASVTSVTSRLMSFRCPASGQRIVHAPAVGQGAFSGWAFPICGDLTTPTPAGWTISATVQPAGDALAASEAANSGDIGLNGTSFDGFVRLTATYASEDATLLVKLFSRDGTVLGAAAGRYQVIVEPSASTPQPSTTAGTAGTASGPRVRFNSIRDALRYIKTRVSVPVVLPSGLPPGMHLAPGHSVYMFGNNAKRGQMLVLQDRQGRQVFIQYGLSIFDGCGADAARPTTVLGQPALIMTSHGEATIIWPATPKRPEGRYGLSGRFSLHEIHVLAASMERKRVRALTGPPVGC